ncbi:hypothetical protein WICMUC_000400 [Wickerhamomyces mucosus]|uniref:endopeptidase La n=1 Tax=Wickerhamomyces mucosus TaxID=1378264 RepID=A0A9P8PXW2_9ASCO|nr:hypothetical protein WICMUC_000400 [Wickerhamomyces mucosus]
MSLNIQTPQKNFLIPLFKLNNSPLVLAPGILYKISFNSKDGYQIINYFNKNNGQINNSLLRKTFPKFTDDNDSKGISFKAIKASKALKKFLSIDTDEDYEWLLCGLIPKLEQQYLTVVRIVDAEFETSTKNFVLTFQALTRGKLEKIYKDEFPHEAQVLVTSNNVEINKNLLNRLVDEFNEKTSSLFEKIDKFLELTEKNEKEISLLPLYQILYLQFQSSEYSNSVTKLSKLINKFNSNYGYNDLNKDSEIYLKLLDLTIAILPIPNLTMLKSFEINDRIQKFNELIDEFAKVFEVLNISNNYIKDFYSNSSDLEKSKLISNQLKSIRNSIGIINPNSKSINSKEANDNELELITKFINNLPPSINKDGINLLIKDYRRLSKMPTQHSEYQVLRNYFEIVIDIPFDKFKNLENFDLGSVERQLNNDHFGLHKVKKRLLQYVSVLKLLKQKELESLEQKTPKEVIQYKANDDLIIGNYQKKPLVPVANDFDKTKLRSPILLFVGPPGVGKTSLAKSIATALGRKFQRVSLGGVRDESEIRGHRRTYVGSMPGVIVNALRKAGTMNPLILLDEIDKVCGGANSAGKVNGDPEAALLEVLDPEQNWNFTDHYIGFPIDLSNVLFICTANELKTISHPLRDRMEIIEISGYSFDEKYQIGERYLLPKQIQFNGLPAHSLKLSQEIWSKLITQYVRESGIRNLERLIGSICRGKAVEFIDDKSSFNGEVKEIELVKYLGLPRFPTIKKLIETPKRAQNYGIVNGLSYNSSGVGDVLLFEVLSIKNPKISDTKIQLTGNLGKTLIESVKISISFIRSMLSRNQISNIDNERLLEKLNHSELNLHVPSGGIEKDGPSAGITITLAILSNILEKKVDPVWAMTGEISLRGKVLPIGGVLEKLLGASQYNLKNILLPKLNERDVIENFSENDEELMKFYNDPDKGLKVLKERINEKLGLKIHFVDTFYDVLKYVWRDDLQTTEELSSNF